MFASFIVASAALVADEKPHGAPLFDGNSLKGWTQRGGKAKYHVEDGCIVGASVPNTSNSFLCTEREYGDFVLELEFKVDPALNSGIQIRSHFAPEGKTIESAGKKIKGGPGGRVFGYQIEIDPATTSYTGGIYDEGRRAWLKDLKDNEPARKAFKAKEWNKLRIECDGPSIRTWINGVKAAEIRDDADAKGFIGLQVHGGGSKKDQLEVRWRNIRIEELKTNGN